jgi:peptidoglycan/xylan/chitin deacetylase (PgdA/CDA1 family)
MYHRIASPVADPWDLAVSAENFAEQLEVLKTFGETQTFTNFARDLISGGGARRRIAVTFDDGYRDNLASALPLLESAEIPATVFVLSGTIGAEREFWWDTITRIFISEHLLPDTLSLKIGEVRHDWSLIDDAGDQGVKPVPMPEWRLMPGALASQRQRVFAELWRALSAASASDKERAVEFVVSWADSSRPGQAVDQPMSQKELCQLATSPLIEIGGHTVTHPLLTLLPPTERKKEISEGRKTLSGILDRPITSFAYPFGDFDAQTAGIVRDAGFDCACTVRPGVATKSTNTFSLPRILVKNWNGDEFARVLKSYAGN